MLLFDLKGVDGWKSYLDGYFQSLRELNHNLFKGTIWDALLLETDLKDYVDFYGDLYDRKQLQCCGKTLENKR